jgi:thiol-disulfide isomerase/thioredoxin
MKHRNIIILLTASLLVSACLPRTGEAVDEPSPNATTDPTETALPGSLSAADKPPAGAENQFDTDFSLHSVPYTEILSGGPPKDGIPSIDFPETVSIAEADEWLADPEAVVVVVIDEIARAYPVQILMWHEIVNDKLGDQEITVTYCPLCNTAIAFDRNFEGMLLDFGTTGRLRFSNLIMYDRQTETWWQQATGEGIAGELTGKQLTTIPAFLVSWEEFKLEYPQGEVLSRNTGYQREYGANPYFGYDADFSDPFLYRGPSTPGQLPPLSRVLTIDRDNETVAFPYPVLETIGVANETVAGESVVIFWQAGTASALDDFKVAEGRDVGSATSYSRLVDDQLLTFELTDGAFTDVETGSTWNHFGQAISGPLAGSQLEAVVSINHFWFSWAAFRPETRIHGLDILENSQQESETSTSPDSGLQLASDFTISLYQGSEQFTSNTISFSDVFTDGKPVVVNFYAGLCPVCRKDMPVLQEAFDEFGEDVEIIGVDIGPFTNLGSEADGRDMLEEFGVNFLAGALIEPSALSTYRILGTPSFLFFNEKGELVRSWIGSLEADQLSAFIQEIKA